MPELGKATYYLELNTAELDAGMARSEARVDKATSSMASKMGMVTKSSEDMGAATSVSAHEVGASMDEAAKEVHVAAGEMTAGFEEAGTAAGEMGREVESGATVAAASSETAAAKIGAAWTAATAKMATMGKRSKAIGRELTHKITLPAAVIGGVGAAMTLQYSDAIRQLETQAGATTKETNAMYDSVLKMAKSGKSASGPKELADALFHLESVGLRGKDAMDALKASEELATVGHANLEDATNALAGAWRVGIRGAENFDEAIGTINATIGAGNLRMPDFISAMGTGVLDAAKFAGLSLQEVGAALASFTARGLPATQMMTKFKMSLLSMKRPTSDQTKALEQMDLSQLQVATSFRTKGLVPTITMLHGRYDALVKKVGKEPADAIFLRAFGGVKSGAAMLSMIQGVKGLSAAYDQIGQKSKSFGELLAAAMDEPQTKMHVALAQLSADAISLGEVVIPILVKVVKGITAIANKFDTLSPQTKKIILIGIGIAALVGPIMSVVGAVATLIGAFGALDAVALPWIALGVAIGAVVAILIGAEVAPKQMAALLVKMGMSVKWAARTVEILRAAFSVLWRGALLELQVFYAYFKTVWKILYDVVRIFIDVFTGDWSDMWERLKDIPKTALKGIEQVFGNTIDAIKGIFGDLGSWLKIKAYGIALDIVEPFSHIPGRFGQWARDAKDALILGLKTEKNAQLEQAARDAAKSYGDVFIPAMGQVGKAGAEALAKGTKYTVIATLATWDAARRRWIDKSGKVIKDQAAMWAKWREGFGPHHPASPDNGDRIVETQVRTAKGPKTTTPTPTPTPETFDPNLLPTGDGGSGKGSGKGAAEFPQFPKWIQRRDLKARQTKTLKDDKLVFEMEIHWLKKLLASRQWSLKQKRAILDALDSAKSGLKDVNAKIKTSLELPDVVLWTTRMSMRETKAERTKSLNDDIAVQMDELAYLKKLLSHTGRKKKDMERRLQIEQEITSVLLKIRDLKEQQKQATTDAAGTGYEMARNVLNERASFFSSFGGNTFQSFGGVGGYKTPGTGARNVPGWTYEPGQGQIPKSVQAKMAGGAHVTGRAAINQLAKQYDMSTRAGLRAAALRYVNKDGSPKTGSGVSAGTAAAGAAGLGHAGGAAGLGGSGMSSKEVTIRTPLVNLYAGRIAHPKVSANRKGESHVTVNLNHLKEATVDKYREAMYAQTAFKHAFDGGESVGG